MRPLLLAALCALAAPPLAAQTKEVINLGSDRKSVV